MSYTKNLILEIWWYMLKYLMKNVNVLELNNVYFKNDSFKIVAE